MKNKKTTIMKFQIIISVFLFLVSCNVKSQDKKTMDINNVPNSAQITLGAGCFWCVEAVFQELKGVHAVKSGYTGGHTKNPTYKEVCTGSTGHAEVAQITFNPSEISFETILSVFFKTHDPTTKDRQGNDVGTQYRSAIYYHTVQQKEIAERIISELNAENVYPNPIVTEVTALGEYYPAEDYHQDYFSNNTDQQYCKYVIQPKVEKFRKVFEDKLK